MTKIMSPCVLVLSLLLSAPVAAHSQDFDSLDADRDSFVTVAEFADFLARSGNGQIAGDMARSYAEHVFKYKDENGDKVLQAHEFGNAAVVPPFQLSALPILKPFADADLDKDGRVTVAELKAQSAPAFHPTMEDYAELADTDGDGISKAEWDANRLKVTRE